MRRFIVIALLLVCSTVFSQDLKGTAWEYSKESTLDFSSFSDLAPATMTEIIRITFLTSQHCDVYFYTWSFRGVNVTMTYEVVDGMIFIYQHGNLGERLWDKFIRRGDRLINIPESNGMQFKQVKVTGYGQ